MSTRKFRRKVLLTGGEDIGGATNRSRLDTSGRLTMEGTARNYNDLWFPATVWYGIEPNGFANAFNATATAATCTPSVLPKNIYGGEAAGSPIAVPTLAASTVENKDARAALCFVAPADAASSGSTSVVLYYTTADAIAESGCVQVWRYHWQFFGSATSDVGGKSGSFVYGASMATTGSGKLEIQTIGTMNAFAAASPFVVLQLTLENSNACAMASAPNEQVYGMRLRYIAENLGAQVS